MDIIYIYHIWIPYIWIIYVDTIYMWITYIYGYLGATFYYFFLFYSMIVGF